MTTVINVPPSLDEHSMELVFEQLAPLPLDEKVLIDARHARWASPYGLTSMLCVAQSRGVRADFAVPDNPDTASYWARAGFFRHAAEVFDLHGHLPRQREASQSDVLLEITPITKTDDIHGVVGRINEKSAEILHGQLGLELSITGRFGMTLSEACGNIVEHAGPLGGWVAVQTYAYRKRLGRRVVVIAICDAGVGFRHSLESSPAHKASDRWDDSRALEAAVLRAVSRYRHGDEGRGQGLAQIRKFIAKWNGKLSVRSGTARLAIVPPWDEDEPMQEALPFFPGAQMQIIIPEKVAESVKSPFQRRLNRTQCAEGALLVTLLIDVGAVLRGSVCELYSNLLTRPTGAAVRHAIERQVVEVGVPVVTTIDFSQVELLDVSCADEIIAKLLLRYDETANPLIGYLLLRGVREDHLEAIDAVLEKRSLALVAWQDGTAALHGAVDEAERSHWNTVRDVGPASTERIAHTLGADEDHTHLELVRLLKRRLLMRRGEEFLIPGMVGPFT